MQTALIIAGVVAWLACAPLAAYLSNGGVGEWLGEQENPIPGFMILFMFAPLFVAVAVIHRASDAGVRRGR